MAGFELPDQGSLEEQQLPDIFALCFHKRVAQQIAILFAKNVSWKVTGGVVW